MKLTNYVRGSFRGILYEIISGVTDYRKPMSTMVGIFRSLGPMIFERETERKVGIPDINIGVGRLASPPMVVYRNYKVMSTVKPILGFQTQVCYTCVGLVA